MSEADERLYLSLTRTELDQVSRALAVAAAADTSAALVALGMALDGRAVPAKELVPVLKGALHALRSYQYGKAAPDLAAGMADTCGALLERLARAGDPLAQGAAADPLAGCAPDRSSSERFPRMLSIDELGKLQGL
ncbi:hypothetical protein V5F40_22850 [Xanthobacter sp. DSM 14520]|uniref:hypothetical protein n=1 Tax=Xanthobacter autotrophicus (strain ATCC BAA-1158 / Py2) TaxID=78245 RepID=UPI003728BA48